MSQKEAEVKKSKKTVKYVLLLFVLLFVLPCRTFAKNHEPRIDKSWLERRIHVLINIERRRAGLRPLALNRKLSAIARRHSRDMADRDYFSHMTPGGRSPLDRYRESGFACRVREGGRIYLGAENIFQNDLYSSIEYIDGRAYYNWNSMEEIARSTVEGWMESPGHRRNILTRAFRSEGIGVAIRNGKVYITQDFC